MSWTYRVFKQVHKYDDGETEEIFSIREYYTEHGLWSQEPDPVVSIDGIEGLKWQLTEMLKALGKPILDIEE